MTAAVLLLRGRHFIASAPLDDPPEVTPAKSEELADSFGVDVHWHFASTVYQHTQRVIDALNDLKVRHNRSRITADGTAPAARAGFQGAAAIGCKGEGICGTRTEDTMAAVMAEVVANYPDPVGTFSAFEGINEPNNDGVAWVATTQQKTQDLNSERNAAGLGAIPIVGPSLARVNSGGAEGGNTDGQAAALGSLSAYVDVGNIHVYPRGREPSTDIDLFTGFVDGVVYTTGEKYHCTEGGYFTALNYTGGAHPNTEEMMRQYVPRQLMEHWIRGNRFFLYELLDDPDPENDDRESNFGMLRVSGLSAGALWTPKPHYYAMKNVISLASDRDPVTFEAAVFTPTVLRVDVTSSATDLKWALFQKSPAQGGKHYLYLWRTVNINSYPNTLSSITVSPKTATVTLASNTPVKVHRPSVNPMTNTDYGSVSEFQVSLTGELMVAEIG